MWPDCPYEIYLNTEYKTYASPYFKINVINLPKSDIKQEYTWSKRLRLCLSKIDSKYILFTLDDIYFLNKIDNKQVESLLNKLDHIKNFAMFCVNNLGPKYYNTKLDLYECHKYCEFNGNIEINIWSKEYLLKIIDDKENIWQAELGLKKRLEETKGKTISQGNNKVFDFDLTKYGIVRGKWTRGTIDLCQKYGIDNDFSKRDFLEIKDNKDVDENVLIWRNYIKDIQKYSNKPKIVYTLKCFRRWMPKSILNICVKIKHLILFRKYKGN